MSKLLRLFTQNHEWLQQVSAQPSVFRIGLSSYAMRALGDAVFVELPRPPKTVPENSPIGIVESVKGASDIYTPIAGTILKINEAVLQKPSILNSDPENCGWLVEIEGTPDSSRLLTLEQYAKYCE